MKQERDKRAYDAFLSYSHADVNTAAAVQRGLHKVGRRMGQLRALRVYRDATDLAANPGFWAKLAEAIAASRYLVAVVSPDAASSEWVNKEISTWIAERGSSNVLIVLAHGTLAWDQDACCFDPAKSTALLPALAQTGVFESEPLYVDLSALASADLTNFGPGPFRSKIIDLAAPIHGKSKDELESEDRTELHKFRRYRGFAISSLLVLFVVSIITSIFAVLQRNEAIEQSANARARELASISLTEDDPDRALALAVEAEFVTNQPVPLARSAYVTAIQRQGNLPARAAGPGLIGHTQEVWDLSWSPHGDQLVSVSADGKVLVWDVDQLEMMTELDRPSTSVPEHWSVAWSSDDEMIATGSADGTVALWEVDSARWIESLELTQAGVHTLRWSPDANSLAIGDETGSVYIWDRITGSSSVLVTGSSEEFRAYYKNDLAWSPDGTRLLSSGINENEGLILDSTGVREPLKIETNTGGIRAVDWSPQGTEVAIGGSNGFMEVYDATDGEFLLEWRVSKDWVDSIAYSPDGEVIASGDRESNLRLFSSKTGDQIGESLTSHVGWVNRVAWSPDGHSIASASTDFTIRVWTVSTQLDAVELQGPDAQVYALAWSPDSKHLVTTYEDSTVIIWDVTSKIQITQLVGHDGPVDAVDWSADGARIATISDDGLLFIWDSTSGEALIQIDTQDNYVQDIEWSPDSKLVASTSSDGTAKIWQSDNGNLHGTLGTPGISATALTALSWAPTGMRVVTGDEDGKLVIWNATTLELEREILVDDIDWLAVNAISWSPNSALIAAGYVDSIVRLWSTDSGEIERRLLGHNAQVFALSWSPDGDMLATASADATVRLWETHSALTTGILSRHNWAADVRAVAWSPDGNQIASAFMTGSAQLWMGISESNACTRALAAIGQEAMSRLIGDSANPPRCIEPASISDLPIVPVITTSDIDWIDE